MAGRRPWVVGAFWLPTCLVTGCLFHGPAGTPLPEANSKGSAVAPDESADGPPAAPATPPPPPPPPPPEALSDYRVMPRQQAAPTQLTASTGVERVALSQPSDPPPDKATSGANPAPADAVKPPVAVPEPPRKDDPPLLAALRCAMEKHPEEAKQLLTRYEKSDRQLLLALVKLTAGVSEGELEKLPPAEVAATLEHLHALSASLKKRAPLALENMLLCRRIEGFGRYETLPPEYEFQAAAEGYAGERVQVYVEVRNFAARPHAEQFVTVLDSELEVCDAQRKKVAVMKLGECQDVSRTTRHDYFLNFQFHVPPQLAPGLYTLWVTVKDTTLGPTPGDGAETRVARRSIDFKVRPRAEAPVAVKKTAEEATR